MHSRLLTLPGVPHRRQRPARRPGLTEANPEPPGSILEGSSGEGKRLGTDRNGRHRVHLPEHHSCGNPCASLTTFFFGNCGASARHLRLRPTTPHTHMHTRRGSGAALRGRPRKQRAPLRAARHRRGRAGPRCRGSSPSCPAGQAGPPGREGSGGAGRSRAARSRAEPRLLPHRDQR